MPSKKKESKTKTTTHSNKNKNKNTQKVVVNIGTGTATNSTSKKGVKSFTKGKSYMGGTPARGIVYPSTTVINNVPSPTMMPFPQMDTNRLNAIENSINNIGSDVQALHGRINRPTPDDVKPYIPSSIDSMRTQLASSAESRISDMETSTPHMHNQITHVLPHADPMSVDTTQPVPMSINTSQQSSSMSTAQFGGSDDSSGGGGGGGGYPPNSPSVQTASTPARIIDRMVLDNESPTASAMSMVSNPSVEIVREKLGKIKTKKEESPKTESDDFFDTPKPSKYDVSPVVAQSYQDMEQSTSGKKGKNKPDTAKSSQGSFSPASVNQRPPSTSKYSLSDNDKKLIKQDYNRIMESYDYINEKDHVMTAKQRKKTGEGLRKELQSLWHTTYPYQQTAPKKLDALQRAITKQFQ